jgi:hypothetical protein
VAIPNSGICQAGNRPWGSQLPPTRSQSIRTLAQIPIEVPLVDPIRTLKYQEIAEEVGLLKKLGLPVYKIARSTGVADKTVLRALEWMNEPTESDAP